MSERKLWYVPCQSEIVFLVWADTPAEVMPAVYAHIDRTFPEPRTPRADDARRLLRLDASQALMSEVTFDDQGVATF